MNTWCFTGHRGVFLLFSRRDPSVSMRTIIAELAWYTCRAWARVCWLLRAQLIKRVKAHNFLSNAGRVIGRRGDSGGSYWLFLLSQTCSSDRIKRPALHSKRLQNRQYVTCWRCARHLSQHAPIAHACSARWGRRAASRKTINVTPQWGGVAEERKLDTQALLPFRHVCCLLSLVTRTSRYAMFGL